jgi:Lar family restriction alleviation protein
MTDNDLDRETKQSTLMPCPFCGHSDVVMTQGDTFRWRLVTCNYCSARGPDVRIQTSGGGTTDEWERKAYDDAIASWNQRAPSNMHLTAYVIGYCGGDCVIMPVDRKRLLNVGLPLYEFAPEEN